MVWIEDQGEGTPLSCTLHFSYFRTSFSFSIWLGEWDHFTRRTETFQMISNLYSYFFVHTLHCMGFQWVLGEEERGGKGRWWDRKYRVWTTLCVASRMLLLHMQEIVFVDSQEGLLSSWGGGGQTYWHQAYSSSLWHCFGPLTGFPAVSLQSLQCGQF